MSDTAHTTPTTPTGGPIPTARAPEAAHAAPQLTSRLPGLAAGVAMLVGFGAFVLIPGGGTTEIRDVLDYYTSDSRRGWAFALALVLIAGCLLTMWFFTVLRSRLADTNATRLAYVFSVIGAAMLAAGVCVALGPTGAQDFSELRFVGVPVAVAMAQAGLAMAIFAGIYPLAAAMVVFGVVARRERAAMPRWLATTSMVVGVLLVASVIGLPAVLLPLWLILVGAVGVGSRA